MSTSLPSRLAGALLAATLSAGVGANAASAPQTRPAGPPLRVMVDPRVELLSIVFRLAGNDEYNRGRVESYTEEVEKHFGIYRNHPTVELARQLRAKQGISFDAVMAMAGHISDTESIRERVPLDPLPPTLDNRWTPRSAREFLEKLRAFVTDSDFNGFFRQHQELYDLTAARMRAVLQKHAHLEWFDSFFGPRQGADFILAPALLNGPGNYGVRCRTPQGEQLFCILGVWSTDVKGLPAFTKDALPTVIHEFTHSYTNPIVEAHLKELRPAGKKLFPQVAAAMRRQAYGTWETVMRESLVRACVIRYTRRYDGGVAAAMATLEERSRSFLWMNDLALLLGEYEAHRDRYPTLETFMPRVIAFFNDYAAKASTQPSR